MLDTSRDCVKLDRVRYIRSSRERSEFPLARLACLLYQDLAYPNLLVIGSRYSPRRAREFSRQHRVRREKLTGT
jgi:hypothetical protein